MRQDRCVDQPVTIVRGSLVNVTRDQLREPDAGELMRQCLGHCQPHIRERIAGDSVLAEHLHHAIQRGTVVVLPVIDGGVETAVAEYNRDDIVRSVHLLFLPTRVAVAAALTRVCSG